MLIKAKFVIGNRLFFILVIKMEYELSVKVKPQLNQNHICRSTVP